MALPFQIKRQCITSTSARKHIASSRVYSAGIPECNAISDMSIGHSGTVFCVLCKKISTGREKLAPIDWHYWHVFATLLIYGVQLIVDIKLLSLNSLCLIRTSAFEHLNSWIFISSFIWQRRGHYLNTWTFHHLSFIFVWWGRETPQDLAISVKC